LKGECVTPDPCISDMIYLNITFHNPTATGHRSNPANAEKFIKARKKTIVLRYEDPGRSEREPRTWCE
jgi:hypothetical protein